MDGDQLRNAAADLNWLRTVWPGPLGAIMATSTSAAGLDEAEVDVEAVGEHQHLALGQVPVAMSASA